MKRKKILFFHFDLRGGGAERVLVNILKYLDREKYEISLKTIFGSGPYASLVPKDVNFSYLFRWEFRGFNWIMKLFSAKFWHRLLVHGHYDIEVGFIENSPTRIVASCPNNKTKKVAWVHTEVRKKKYLLFGFRDENEMIMTYNNLDHVVFVAKRPKECFENMFPKVTVPKMHVIHNVNDFEQIYELAKECAPIDIDAKHLNLCVLGRLVQVKGIPRLVSAFSRLRNDGLTDGVKVYILGKGSKEDSIRQLIIEAGLSEQLILLGFDSNPYRYLSKMDLFVCTSYREGYSTAATESIALGVPVFTTDCSGMDEILEGGKYGMIVPNDDESIYLGLKDLLTHREKIDQYASNIKDLSNVTTQALVDEYEKFFDSL